MKSPWENIPSEDIEKTAQEIIKDAPLLARAVYQLLQNEYRAEDLISKFGEFGLNESELSDEEMTTLVEGFSSTLSNNDGYWACYWASAETAIEKFLNNCKKD